MQLIAFSQLFRIFSIIIVTLLYLLFG